MSFPRSWVGGVLGLGYTILAIWAVQDELRHAHGGWINLRGMGVVLVTAPSQLLFERAFRVLGVPPVRYGDPGLSGYLQIAFHVLVTLLFVYLLGAGLEWLARRMLRSA